MFNQKKYFLKLGQISEGFVKSKDYKKAVDLLFECWRGRGTVFTMGCGGSAATATHFAADLAKSTIVPGKKRLKTVSLTDNTPLVSAWINDSGWGSVFAEQLEGWLTRKDVLIGFSVHGGSGEGEAGPWSQNLVAAMNLAKKRKAKIIGFSGFDGGAMKQLSDVCLIVQISEEPYATPLIEGFHSILSHAITFELKSRIEKFSDK